MRERRTAATTNSNETEEAASGERVLSKKDGKKRELRV
jgi:hypothetical protein